MDALPLRTQNHPHQLTSPLSSPPSLDLEYLQIKDDIKNSRFFVGCDRHTHIRLSQWLRKLDQIISNQTWRKNRNNYAKVMRLMCECEVVLEPFNRLPPAKDVPKISKHDLNKVIDRVEAHLKTEREEKGLRVSLAEP